MKSISQSSAKVQDQAPETKGFDDEVLTAGNDQNTLISNEKTKDKTSRLKAARLEKLLANQLEKQLQIDAQNIQEGGQHQVTTNPSPLTVKTPTAQGHDDKKQNKPVRPSFVKHPGFAQFTSDIHKQAKDMKGLLEKSNGFLEYIGLIEKQFANVDSLEKELDAKRRETIQLKQQQKSYLKIFDKQRKQIERLEASQTSMPANPDRYPLNENELDELSRLKLKYHDLKKHSLEEQDMLLTRISKLEESVLILRAQIEKSDGEKDDITQELKTAKNLLTLQDEMVSILSTEKS